jgi:PilZ domain
MARDHTQDRRRRQRFPLSLDVRWRSLATEEEGEGQIINVSSAGILFTSRREFAIGEGLELSIHWPYKPDKMDSKLPLKLVALTRVVRCEGDRTAVSIEQYEFRLEEKKLDRRRQGRSKSAS